MSACRPSKCGLRAHTHPNRRQAFLRDQRGPFRPRRRRSAHRSSHSAGPGRSTSSSPKRPPLRGPRQHQNPHPRVTGTRHYQVSDISQALLTPEMVWLRRQEASPDFRARPSGRALSASTDNHSPHWFDRPDWSSSDLPSTAALVVPRNLTRVTEADSYTRPPRTNLTSASLLRGTSVSQDPRGF